MSRQPLTFWGLYNPTLIAKVNFFLGWGAQPVRLEGFPAQGSLIKGFRKGYSKDFVQHQGTIISMP